MAKSKKYDELAAHIIGLIGGEENIVLFTHCMTRLRFNVKDKGLVDTDQIGKLEGVVGTQWANDQLQIIIGQSVENVYNLICETNGIKKEAAVNENVADDKKKFGIMNVLDGITGCIVPLIPIFLGSGLIKVLCVLGNLMGFLPSTSSTYSILTMASDAALYFMPILVGYTAAKKFNADVSLAMGLCAVLVYPSFMTAITGDTTATIFGLPIYSATYSNMIFPSIMIVYVMSHVERFFKKIMPELIRVMMVPLCTLLVMLPLALCVIAPAGIVLGNGITFGVEFIYNRAGFLGVGILSAIYPLLIITGMHSTLAPVCISFFTKLGFDPLIIPACYIANFNQAAASFAVTLKVKDKNAKAIASSASITALLAGVTEPALFGVTFRYKKPLVASIIGGFVGGCYVGIMHCKLVAMSGLGVFALAGFISDDIMNFVNYIIGTVLGMVVTFVLTLILFKDPATTKKEA